MVGRYVGHAPCRCEGRVELIARGMDPGEVAAEGMVPSMQRVLFLQHITDEGWR